MSEQKTIVCSRCNKENTEVRSFILHLDGSVEGSVKVSICQHCLSDMFKSLKKDDSILEGEIFDYKKENKKDKKEDEEDEELL